LLNFTIIKLSLAVILGVIFGFFFEFSADVIWPFGLLLLTGFLLNYLRAKRLFLQDAVYGINVLLIFFFFGTFAASLHLPKNQPLHFIHHLPEENFTTILEANISEKLKPGVFQDKYILKAEKLNGLPVKGKILLNIQRDSLTPDFKIGDELAIGADLSHIITPKNPYQFNYRKYMEDLGVMRQINAREDQILLRKSGSGDFQFVAGAIRNKIVSSLRNHEFEYNELAIIQALLLGQRQEISQEIYSNYAAAGVIHILAVSGLHVGIILLLLNRILKPLERRPKGKIIKTILLLLLLWGFAVLAGLSPSVVRAVSMFSFVAIGMQLKRRTSVLNTLFMSLLVLLLINPRFITQVGFQLSYAAVFSIVLVQPHLYKLYSGKFKPIKYLWGIFSVTLAAQVGVLPLSLFYFHQFPGLFFISNLVILPFLGLILGMGILVMILALLNILPGFLAEIFGWMISLLNQFVAWTATKEDFLFENISFSLLLCITSYFLVVGFILLLKDFQYKTVIFFLISIIVFQAAIFYEKFSAADTESLVFHKSRNTIIGTRTNDKLILVTDVESPPLSYSFIKDYYVEKNIDAVESREIRNIFNIEDKQILLIDSLGIYKIPGLKPDIVLLTKSPAINLERLLRDLSPEIIIADGSNYPSAIRRWKETANNFKIPFHATGEKGAYVFGSSTANGNLDLKY